MDRGTGVCGEVLHTDNRADGTTTRHTLLDKGVLSSIIGSKRIIVYELNILWHSTSGVSYLDR